MEGTLNITGVDKAEILRVLYNHSKPLGMGMLQYIPGDLSTEDSQILIKRQKSFDYLQGRVMKIDLSGDTLRTGLYNRDNGDNAAEKILKPLLEKRG